MICKRIVSHHHHLVKLLARISLTLSLDIRSYHPSLPAGLLNYILCSRKVVVGRFLLVSQNRQLHVKGSIGEHHL